MFIFEFLFHTISGWIGHIIIKFVTLGKVDLAWGAHSDSETPIAEGIGSLFLLFLAAVTIWAV